LITQDVSFITEQNMTAISHRRPASAATPKHISRALVCFRWSSAYAISRGENSDIRQRKKQQAAKSTKRGL